ncbi:hypothetical protein DY000_02045307 [Brassica cretica]|uniref:Uncharacterized protein n=1 Tax=Brassica cretica TaxID=69181 RepID=A0ABQ7EQC9_BRACR|nr:hypothetical protein DY000_02045307 [Brassica cretica]
MVSSHLSADVMSLVDTLPVLAKTLAVAKTAVAPWKGSKFYCRLEQTTSGPLVLVPLLILWLAQPQVELQFCALDLARTKLAYQDRVSEVVPMAFTANLHIQALERCLDHDYQLKLKMAFDTRALTMAYKEGGPRGLYLSHN